MHYASETSSSKLEAEVKSQCYMRSFICGTNVYQRMRMFSKHEAENVDGCVLSQNNVDITKNAR